jgi:hypothetical protein
MDDITVNNCVIQYAIMHVVNNREERPMLADEALSLGDDLALFLCEHIVTSIAASSVAVFDERETNDVSIACERIFGGQTNLVSQSQRLARRLFDLMRPRTIKSGTFWTIHFGGTDGSSKYLALMKMDDVPTYVYRSATRGGRRIVNLSVNPRTLPNTKMKLDKAAFIVPSGTRGFDYELRVLDKVLPEERVAAYFKQFLSYHAPQTDREKTRIFFRAVETWIQENHRQLPDTISEQHLRELKRAYLNNNEQVSIRDFASAAFGDQYPNLRASFSSHLRSNGLLDPQFNVDQREWAKHSTKLAYRLRRENNSVEIKGDFDEVRALVEIREPSQDDPHYYATIKADALEEVVR